MPPLITVLGMTYKADVPDTRNSKVVDLVRELEKFGAHVQVIDPLADPVQVTEEYGIVLMEASEAESADVVILAVPHAEFIQGCSSWETALRLLRDGAGLVADIPAKLDRDTTPDGVHLWRF